jgi:hypothetical protein
MAGVKVTFKVGNRRGVMNQDVDAQNSFVDAMGDETTRKASVNFEVDVPRLQRVLDTRISASLKQAVTFAAMNMIGVKSNVNTQGRADPTKILFNMGEDRGDQGEGDKPLINPSSGLAKVFGSQGFELQWAALSRRTIMKKSTPIGGRSYRGTSPREEAKKFFTHTGSLQREIKNLAADVVGRTGSVKVYYAKGENTKSLRIMQNQTRVRVGQLQLRFLPKVPIRTLKGFLTEDPTYTDGTTAFEKSLGLSPAALVKLQGIEGYHRPLLQPVFSYWMLTRIPSLVGTAISNSIRTR